jgi:Zn-dependent peptidase ImmA (M78 family)
MADLNKARSEAHRVLDMFGVSAPPIDPERIAEQLGVDVVYAKFKPEVSQAISGFIHLPEGKPQIVVNASIPAKRKMFTIAHELGHFLMHLDYIESDKYRVLPRSNGHVGAKPDEEKEADVFAAALIAPKDLVNKYRGIASLPEMSRIFVASEEMLKWRMHNIDAHGN